MQRLSRSWILAGAALIAPSWLVVPRPRPPRLPRRARPPPCPGRARRAVRVCGQGPALIATPQHGADLRR